nr:hypothetical protein [Tanacetum cinerariifolium]
CGAGFFQRLHRGVRRHVCLLPGAGAQLGGQPANSGRVVRLRLPHAQRGQSALAGRAARRAAHGRAHRGRRARVGPAAGFPRFRPHLRPGGQPGTGAAVRILLGHDFLLRGVVYA